MSRRYEGKVAVITGGGGGRHRAGHRGAPCGPGGPRRAGGTHPRGARAGSGGAGAGALRGGRGRCRPTGGHERIVDAARSRFGGLDGPTDTALIRQLEAVRSRETDGQGRETILRGMPLARYGEPDEIARLIAFLASDEASFCTGGVYTADGGLSAV